MNQQRPSLLEFPCDFQVKAFGHASGGFDAQVVAIMRRHAPDLAEGAVHCRLSGGGKYIAVTVNLRAQSQAQLDAIYRELSASPEVLMVL